MRARIYWIRWKLTKCMLIAYIKCHRFYRKMERKWIERKGAKTTWDDVIRELGKGRIRDNKYFDRLGRWSSKSDRYWREYIKAKYR